MDDSDKRETADIPLTGATVSWAGAARPEPVSVAGAPHSARYSVVEQIGAGGMGVVYVAHDRELNRRVALKVLRPESRSEAADARLQREAQAMARLDHPNVVAVYDVGRLDEGQVFVAMELVKGDSLRKWLAAQERSRREIIEVFAEAGRGLAAAHEGGLVHRDFKPDNVLVGEDGVVRVADFGLARIADGEQRGSVAPTPIQGVRPVADSFIEQLTKTGALVGTPLYMSPEQLRGEPSDARSDQFGFCVALYEALYRQRPFEAKTTLQLLDSITAGPQKPPRATKVPARIFEAVRRGLHVDPQQRFPTVDDLLRALLHDPWQARRRAAAGALLLGLVGVSIVVAVRASRERDLRCKGAERKLAGVWDGARRTALQSALLAAPVPYAAAAAQAALKGLDAYAAAFLSAHVDACEAAQIRGEQSSAIEDLRMTCLEQRRNALGALVHELSKGDKGVAERAARAVAGLPEISTCADVTALQAKAPLPRAAEARARIAAIARDTSRAEALRLAGRLKEGLPVAKRAVEEARATGHAPLIAEAELVTGLLHEDVGEVRAAEEHLQDALFSAIRGHAEETAIRAATGLAMDVGRLQGRIKEGRTWARLAQAMLPRAGDGRAEQRLEFALGLVSYAEGRYEDARKHYLRSLELSEKLHGPHHLRSVDMVNSLGGVSNALGRLDEAEAYYKRALPMYEALYGAEHPQLAIAIANLSTIPFHRGRHADAEKGFRRALEILEKNLGPQHPRVGTQIMNVAEAVLKQGRTAEAVALHSRALGVHIAAVGAQSAIASRSRVNLGLALLAKGDRKQARAQLEKAQAAQVKVLGPEHPDLVRTLSALGDVERADKRLDAAQAAYEKALALAGKAFGAEHGQTASVELSLAEALLDRRQPEAAQRRAQNAQAAIAKVLGPDHPDAILAGGLIGRALSARGEPGAIDALEKAVAAWARIGGGSEGDSMKAALSKLLSTTQR